MNQYSFKIHDGELRASAELIIMSENPPTGEVFDKLISQIKKQAVTTGVNAEGGELEGKDPNKMDQREFERFRLWQEARRRGK